jgi:glycosyltransferase involved in cell wall biosynthesis
VKIAFHVDQLWFSAPGGIGTYVRELLAALEIGGGDVRPFRAEFAGPPRIAAQMPADPVVVTGSIRSLYPRWDILGRPELPEPLWDADVVHATNHAAVAPARAEQRLVVTVHDLAFDRFPQLFSRRWRWLYRAGVRAAIKRAHAILVPSAATRGDLVRRGVDPNRIHVTPLASSLEVGQGDPGEILDRLGISRPYMLCAATLEPRKNLVRLIRAYRELAAAGLPHALVLAGPDGWASKDIAREIDEQGPGRILRTGLVTGEHLDSLYRGASVLAYPSLYEGFGLPVVEAMARGVPVVTSDVSSLPEVGGNAVCYVDPTSVDAIASGLRHVLEDESFAESLRAAGPVQARSFSWAATAEATLDAYEQVIGATA